MEKVNLEKRRQHRNYKNRDYTEPTLLESFVFYGKDISYKRYKEYMEAIE